MFNAAAWFQHTAARRRLVIQSLQDNILEPVSTHSRPKAAGAFTHRAVPAAAVSTHSRPKAAGPEKRSADWLEICFNTQPPEGGWRLIRGCFARSVRFQHTAARRRLEVQSGRLKVWFGCFNTQPPEGGWRMLIKAAVMSL